MSPRLFGNYKSRCLRVLWLAREVGLTLDLVPVIQAFRLPDGSVGNATVSTKSPEFLKINPAGAIPVLDDDGFVLTESNAIILYLAKKSGGVVAPADDKEEALMHKWGLFCASSIDFPLDAIGKAHREGWAETDRGQTAIAEASGKLIGPLQVIDATLDNKPYMIGDRFTAADIIVAETVRPIQNMPALLAERPNLTNWLAACHARPAFKTVWDARLAEPA